MEPSHYEYVFRTEDTHWVKRGLRDMVDLQIRRFGRRGRPLAMLDAGCGSGRLLIHLGQYGTAWGIDFAPQALSLCARRGLTEQVSRASVNALPFAERTFDLVCSMDVLYHRAVDDRRALREYYRTLKPGGLLLVNVPAYDWLRRDVDRVVHTRHRYRRREMVDLLRQAGLTVCHATYRNSVLFPAVLATLFLPHDAADQASRRDGIVNRVLSALIKAENRASSRLPLPFGLSVWCAAIRPPE